MAKGTTTNKLKQIRYICLILAFYQTEIILVGFWNERKAEREIEKQHAKTERDIAEDNQREVVLQEYINKMSELLLHENLRKSKPEDEVRSIARVRTLTVLGRLNGRRKSSLSFFCMSRVL